MNKSMYGFGQGRYCLYQTKSHLKIPSASMNQLGYRIKAWSRKIERIEVYTNCELCYRFGGHGMMVGDLEYQRAWGCSIPSIERTLL